MTCAWPGRRYAGQARRTAPRQGGRRGAFLPARAPGLRGALLRTADGHGHRGRWHPCQSTVAARHARIGDSLVVWKLDRLARSTRQLLEPVETLEQRGIGLRILTQNIDTTNAGGRLIFTVFSAIAEFEREIICERTRAGLDAARARDRRGGPRSLSEKDLKEAKALLADPEITVEAVARRLGVGPSTLYRYLPAARQSIQEDKGYNGSDRCSASA